MLRLRKGHDVTRFKWYICVAGAAAVASTALPVTTYAGPNSRTASTGVCPWIQEPANVLPSMSTGFLYGVTVASPKLAWAVGNYYNSATGSFGSLIEKWTGGRKWSVVGTGGANAQLNAVVSFGAARAFAVGSVGDQGLVSTWNGVTWERTKLPVGGDLYDVSGSSPRNVWASGNIGGTEMLLEHFDGTSWNRVTIPADLHPVGDSFHVLVLSPTDVEVDGATISGTPIWKYDGRSWSVVASPVDGPMVGSSATNIWAVDADGSTVVHWNGETWNRVGDHVAGFTNGLARGATGVWSVGALIPANDIFIAKNGEKLRVPVIPASLNAVATGFGVTFAVGGDNGAPLQPVVLQSCG
jgi:hypothetical protein